MNYDIMLDLETWGTKPGCDLRSIGACYFDPENGVVAEPDTIGTFYVATENPRGYWGSGPSRDRFYRTEASFKTKYPLKRDTPTVQWWSEQSEEAQGAFEKPVDLKDALSRFSRWFNDTTPDATNIRFWAHSPQFDVTILAAAYDAVGLDVPWHYRSPRDTRTLFDAAGIADHSEWLEMNPGPIGIPHHALDDAICQARAVCAAWDNIAWN